MRSVVSVSLGSSKRDKIVMAEFLGETFSVERVGTDGNLAAAGHMIERLDGQVEAIGLGGIDLYLIAGGKKHVIRDAAKMAARAKTTPVVDGSGLKHTWEREVVRRLVARGELHPLQEARGIENLKVLVTSAVDRFGMAEAMAKTGCEVLYGDVIFGLGFPLPLRRLWQIRLVAAVLLPILVRQPFEKLYPTGEKQDSTTPKFRKYYDWADVICGDMHLIKRFAPPAVDGERPFEGKVVLTNTTTEQDVEVLREQGLSRLITTTPRMDGRSFGTNVMEALIVALLGKKLEEIEEGDYLAILDKLGWEPSITELNP